jgi:hypothetical protein
MVVFFQLGVKKVATCVAKRLKAPKTLGFLRNTFRTNLKLLKYIGIFSLFICLFNNCFRYLSR